MRQERPSVHARKHNVQDDQVVATTFRKMYCLVTVSCGIDYQTILRQSFLRGAADLTSSSTMRSRKEMPFSYPGCTLISRRERGLHKSSRVKILDTTEAEVPHEPLNPRSLWLKVSDGILN